MSFDLNAFLRRAEEDERRDRWTLAFSGVCPRCNNAKGHSFLVDHETGEREWVPCQFCRSEAELEREAEQS